MEVGIQTCVIDVIFLDVVEMSWKAKQEAAMVRRRNAEWDRQQLWGGVTQYFHNWEVLNKKHNELSSPRFYKQRYLIHI